MNKRCFLLISILIFVLTGCKTPASNVPSESGNSAEINPVAHIAVLSAPKMVDIYTIENTFESFEKNYPVGERLDRNSVFGDSELQKEAEQLRTGLDMTVPTHVLTYAYKLLPLIKDSGYVDAPEGEWMVRFLCHYEDGVWEITYHEIGMLPENYESMTADDRDKAYSGWYGGGTTVSISSSDGHLISLEGPLHRIEGKETLPPKEETTIPSLKWQGTWFATIKDYTMAEYFTGWTGEQKQRYADAPMEVTARFGDNTLQQAAAEASAGLWLATIEGMSEYAVQLGEILCETDYNMCANGFTVNSITRYTDGAWEICLKFADPASGDDDKTQRTYVYVSEADGHIICMFDSEDQLVTAENS